MKLLLFACIKVLSIQVFVLKITNPHRILDTIRVGVHNVRKFIPAVSMVSFKAVPSNASWGLFKISFELCIRYLNCSA